MNYIEFVKNYSSKNNISYKKALSEIKTKKLWKKEPENQQQTNYIDFVKNYASKYKISYKNALSEIKNKQLWNTSKNKNKNKKGGEVKNELLSNLYDPETNNISKDFLKKAQEYVNSDLQIKNAVEWLKKNPPPQSNITEQRVKRKKNEYIPTKSFTPDTRTPQYISWKKQFNKYNQITYNIQKERYKQVMDEFKKQQKEYLLNNGWQIDDNGNFYKNENGAEAFLKIPVLSSVIKFAGLEPLIHKSFNIGDSIVNNVKKGDFMGLVNDAKNLVDLGKESFSTGENLVKKPIEAAEDANKKVKDFKKGVDMAKKSIKKLF